MGQAANQAAEIRSQDQLANSKMQADYEKAREMEALNQQMVAHQMSQADWSRMFAEQSASAQLQMAYQQAALQLRLALMR
jgi:putative IMPACT (imprinted ancient) family translation regulator